MTLTEVYDILFNGAKLRLDSEQMERVELCYRFLEKFARDKVIYGINTGFGPMAQWRVDDKYLKDLQYNIIRSHSTGAGTPLSPVQVKAAMIARTMTLAQARSGVHPDTLRLLAAFVNNDITPMVPCHGSVGASGDLVQLAHIALTLLGEGEVLYHNEWQPAGGVLESLDIKPLEIHIREGLSLTNGTSVMTGIAIVNLYHATNLLHYATMAASWLNEIAGSYDDYMSVELNEPRRQPGQQAVAAMLRRFSQGSTCLRKREHELYTDINRDVKVFSHKVQAYYSLRCIPQVYGPVFDTLSESHDTLERELNSACDNPIIDYESANVLHGGNFHGDYISLDQDKVKIALVRVVMTMERQLNYLFHDRINGILPPFLNSGTLGLNYGMQACQFTATSTTAECQTLSMPNYVHSIPNNNDNQDIVSMGTNTALLTGQVIDNGYQVLSILMMALAQATDILNSKDKLASDTKSMYDAVRSLMPPISEDTPFYKDIEAMINHLRTNILQVKI